MNLLFSILASFVIGYGLGAIPFGLLLVQMFGVGDLRAIGSGNIGATNVMRTGRKGLALATLLLDAGKGAAAVFIMGHLYSWSVAPIAGLMAVLGHVFPFWLRFRGGKGVATTLGVLLALNWQLGLFVCVAWLLIFLFTRTSSLASMLSIGWSSVIAYMLSDFLVTLVCLCLATLVVFSHRGNIKRLLQGTEHRFSTSVS